MMTGVTFDLRVPGDRIEPSSDHPCAAVLGKDLVVRVGTDGTYALPRLGELPGVTVLLDRPAPVKARK